MFCENSIKWGPDSRHVSTVFIYCLWIFLPRWNDAFQIRWSWLAFTIIIRGFFMAVSLYLLASIWRIQWNLALKCCYVRAHLISARRLIIHLWIIFSFAEGSTRSAIRDDQIAEIRRRTHGSLSEFGLQTTLQCSHSADRRCSFHSQWSTRSDRVVNFLDNYYKLRFVLQRSAKLCCSVWRVYYHSWITIWSTTYHIWRPARSPCSRWISTKTSSIISASTFYHSPSVSCSTPIDTIRIENFKCSFNCSEKDRRWEWECSESIDRCCHYDDLSIFQQRRYRRSLTLAFSHEK